MWRSGNFAQSMFYFALKIKRLESRERHVPSSHNLLCESRDFSAVEKASVSLRTVKQTPTLEQCSQTQGAASKGDIDDDD